MTCYGTEYADYSVKTMYVCARVCVCVRACMCVAVLLHATKVLGGTGGIPSTHSRPWH
jgi:hypothetical protein